jgi:hypothetical protein
MSDTSAAVLSMLDLDLNQGLADLNAEVWRNMLTGRLPVRSVQSQRHQYPSQSSSASLRLRGLEPANYQLE